MQTKFQILKISCLQAITFPSLVRNSDVVLPWDRFSALLQYLIIFLFIIISIFCIAIYLTEESLLFNQLVLFLN